MKNKLYYNVKYFFYYLNNNFLNNYFIFIYNKE